jgi:hypothetical protein
LTTLFLRGGLAPHDIVGPFRIVDNEFDQKGGCFVMLGSPTAPANSPSRDSGV